jgi:hypothetical protein
MSKEAMKLALRSLKELVPDDSDYAPALQGQRKRQEKAIAAIKQALEQPVQQSQSDVEPVAWCTKSDLENMAKGFSQDVPARSMRVPQLYPKEGTVLLYTTPPAAPVQEPEYVQIRHIDEVGDASPWGQPLDPKERHTKWAKGFEMRLLYTAPPAAQRQWVGLTDEQVTRLCKTGTVYAPDGVVTRTPLQYREELEGVARTAVRKAEAKLKELNA